MTPVNMQAGTIGFDPRGFAGPGFPPSAARAQADFASILGIADRGVRDGTDNPVAQAREAAEQFVAKVFIEPALAISRESSDLPPPFGAGSGEKQFSSLMDAQRAMDLVRSSEWPIVDRLVRDMTRAEGTPGGTGVPPVSSSHLATSRTGETGGTPVLPG
ncbi:MAG: hypothetical protein K8E66_01990 [Phycisphaerales bacterium]|nr:hypothetical protein [Phycisphaerales bacterium]